MISQAAQRFPVSGVYDHTAPFACEKKKRGDKKRQRRSPEPPRRPPLGQSEASEGSLRFTVANPAHYGKSVNPSAAIQPLQPDVSHGYYYY